MNTTIAYHNLRAEMSRQKIGLREMSRILNINRETLSRRLSKRTPLSLDDAMKIQEKFFPDHSLRYLFDYE